LKYSWIIDPNLPQLIPEQQGSRNSKTQKDNFTRLSFLQCFPLPLNGLLGFK
jgi:hypothetical protein